MCLKMVGEENMPSINENKEIDKEALIDIMNDTIFNLQDFLKEKVYTNRSLDLKMLKRNKRSKEILEPIFGMKKKGLKQNVFGQCWDI